MTDGRVNIPGQKLGGTRTAPYTAARRGRILRIDVGAYLGCELARGAKVCRGSNRTLHDMAKRGRMSGRENNVASNPPTGPFHWGTTAKRWVVLFRTKQPTLRV